MKEESNKLMSVEQLKEGMKLINEKTFECILIEKITEIDLSLLNLATRQTESYRLDSPLLKEAIKTFCPFNRIHIRTGNQYLIVNPSAQIKLPDCRWVPAIIYTDGENDEKTGKFNREWIRLADDFNKKFSEVKL